MTIHLLNENDHDPEFTEDSYNFNVTENNLLKQVIGNIIVATDADGDDITYFTKDNNSKCIIFPPLYYLKAARFSSSLFYQLLPMRQLPVCFPVHQAYCEKRSTLIETNLLQSGNDFIFKIYPFA